MGLIELPHVSHSQIRSWRSCQQQHEYRYGQLLIPKRETRPLYFGNWFHACLEAHYKGEGWRTAHQKYCATYDRMPEEEQQVYDRNKSRAKPPWEPLPLQIERAMRSYLWYRHTNPLTMFHWKVIAVELPFELTITLDDGRKVILKGRIDLVVQDQNGKYWVVDHKTTTTIPDETAFHAMDPQLIIYPEAASALLGIEIEGVIYNYIKSKAPTIPKMNKDGKTISKQDFAADYVTLYRFLKDNNLDPAEYSDILLPLQRQSPFLARYRLPRTAPVTERVLQEARWTTREILDHTTVTRNVTRQCDNCSYQQLCRADLFGLDTSYIRAEFFIKEDALDPGHGEYNPSESEGTGGSD